MEFKIGDTTFSRIRLDRVYGQRALGFCRLLLRFEMHVVSLPGEDDKTVVTDLSGDLRIGPDYVGRLEPEAPPVSIRTHRPGMNQKFRLVTELDAVRLEAIEDLRMGNGLKFDVALRAVVKGGGETEQVSEAGSVEVNQSDWIRVLGELGYCRMMLLEVPMPDQSTSPKLSQAVASLRGAQDAILSGHYRDAVGCCRDSLESLSEALGDTEKERQASFENVKARDKEARVRIVRRALRTLCHPARHGDGNAVKIEWDRADAIAVVSMTAALLRLCGGP